MRSPDFECDGVKLFLGDCLDVLPELEAGSVDAVVTDPPFGEVTHNGARTRTVGANSDALIGFDAITPEQFAGHCSDLVRLSSGWVVSFCDWRHAAYAEATGLPLVRVGVWVKPNSAPQLTGDRPATGWEAIAIFHRVGAKKWNGGGSRAVWTANRVDAEFHPAQKPLALLGQLICLFSDPSELVLDPFMGSGTTGVACIRTGRKFIGIEKEPRYFEIAVKRITDELKRNILFEPAPKITQRSLLE